MSANNEVLIRKVDANDSWEVREVDVDALSDYGVEKATNELVAVTTSLETAIGVANKYMEENYVEYGLNVLLQDKENQTQ